MAFSFSLLGEVVQAINDNEKNNAAIRNLRVTPAPREIRDLMMGFALVLSFIEKNAQLQIGRANAIFVDFREMQIVFPENHNLMKFCVKKMAPQVFNACRQII